MAARSMGNRNSLRVGSMIDAAILESCTSGLDQVRTSTTGKPPIKSFQTQQSLRIAEKKIVQRKKDTSFHRSRVFTQGESLP